jgi:hypothetical protein
MTTAEVSHALQSDVYDPDDVGLRDSPLLKPLRPKLDPTPSPPPEEFEYEDSPPRVKGSKPWKKTSKLPSQGDAVLINLLGGGQALEVSRTAATELLASDDDMSEDSSRDVLAHGDQEKSDGQNDLAALAASAMQSMNATHVATAPGEETSRDHGRRDDIVSTVITQECASLPNLQGAPSVVKTERSDEALHSPHHVDVNGGTELAPIQEMSPKSAEINGMTLPSITDQLGSIDDLKQLAEAASSTMVVDKDASGGHRPSFSQSQSPPRPPIFQLPLGPHGSPPLSPIDSFQRGLPSPGRGSVSVNNPYYYAGNPRRPSTSTEGTLYPYTPGDSSNSTETPSTDQSGSTPAGMPTVIDRMSIDEITNPQIGGFHCTYDGCTAQPFQTQYLLNSHANVHSSNRPHYCPVKGCPRSEGGKGFKRKNEMIRHGLVHESPGYVCPYCQDREHRYPRPDNLQR